MAGKTKQELLRELKAAGIKPQDVQKFLAAGRTPKQSAGVKKAQSKLAKAKKAKAKFDRSFEGRLAKASKRRTKKKR